MVIIFVITTNVIGKGIRIIDDQKRHVVNNLPADVLAPSGARTSAGTVITNFRSNRYVEPALGSFDFFFHKKDMLLQSSSVSLQTSVFVHLRCWN